MKTITTLIADPVGHQETIEPLTLVFSRAVSGPGGDTDRAMYRREAAAIVAELVATIPGGLFDALLVEFLAHKASILRVPLTPKQA